MVELLAREHARAMLIHQLAPVHPVVKAQFEAQGHIDYDALSSALDALLPWLYEDLQEHPSATKEHGFSNLQHRDGTRTDDPQVILDWTESKHGPYVEQRGEQFYGSEELQSFPVPSLHPDTQGIYIGQTPTNIDTQQRVIPHSQTIDEILDTQTQQDFGIQRDNSSILPGVWYTKDGSFFQQLFQFNFIACYTNAMVQRYA